jgi:tRNA1(Val) A37 N6-methylase TrmN6
MAAVNALSLRPHVAGRRAGSQDAMLLATAVPATSNSPVITTCAGSGPLPSGSV